QLSNTLHSYSKLSTLLTLYIWYSHSSRAPPSRPFFATMSSKLGFQQRLQELASKASELFCGDNNLEVNPNLEKYFTPAFLDLINRHSRQTSCSSEGFSTVEQGFLQEFERLQKMFFP